MTARIVQLSRSAGGVPKLPVDEVDVTVAGMDGDAQNDRQHHGGPERALCLYSAELIDALVREGHPVVAGALGENVTIRGLDWSTVQPGCELQLGDVRVVVTRFTVPCTKIRDAFVDKDFTRISQQLHRGWARVYVRVLREGRLRTGDPVILSGPPTVD
jgi:MOSC domain-containing protein YiiM